MILKENKNFQKMFIVTEYAALNIVLLKIPRQRYCLQCLFIGTLGIYLPCFETLEHSGSVECLSPDRGVVGFSLANATVLCS